MFLIWLWELNLFFQRERMNHRIEPFFFDYEYDSQDWTFCIWLKELKFFLNLTQWIEPSFFNMSRRIEPSFCVLYSKNWPFFWTWLTELNLFFTSLEDLNPFLMWHRELNLLFWSTTQRIEPFSKHDSKNWTFCFNVTQRIEFFLMWLKELISSNVTQRIELFSNVYDSQNWTFSEYDSKNCTLLFSIWVKELNPFFKILLTKKNLFKIWRKELNCFFQYDAKNEPFLWFEKMNLFNMIQKKTFFNMTLNIELFFLLQLKELNPFFPTTTQRIEP